MYRPPWQIALHRWMDAVTPGERTYTRASRRGADRTDVVLPGRLRAGWSLSIVLDTSGSMSSHLARALGPEPVRAGLYFPLLAAWREVAVDPQG
jgi:predicted metal-dependent peptidase